MQYGWAIQGLRTGLYLALPSYVGVPHARDATIFSTRAEAEAAIESDFTIRGHVRAIDVTIYPAPPADADNSPVLTRDQVIRNALVEDNKRAAKRAANWKILPRPGSAGEALPFAAAAAIVLALLITATPAHARHSHRQHRPAHHVNAAIYKASAVNAPIYNGAVSTALHYLGTNPTHQLSLWCADFVNLIERSLGRPGTGSREAKSYLRYGQKVAAPRPGDIVVLARRGGGHVGYFIRDTPRGPELISGNTTGRRVGVGVYPRSRVLAYVRPTNSNYN